MIGLSKTEEYLNLNGKYLREGQELLKKGDYVQASEKLWGAAAEIVKAVAASRGVALGTHRSLWGFVHNLSRERPEMNLLEGFRAAESLHTNFYEDHLPVEIVKISSDEVRKFIDNLRSLLDETKPAA